MSEATPRPWKRESAGGRGAWIGNDNHWAALSCGLSAENADANAALIVKAVNRDHLFDEMVKAMTEMSRQKTINEMTQQEFDEGDVWGAYETFIESARAILSRVAEAERQDIGDNKC